MRAATPLPQPAGDAGTRPLPGWPDATAHPRERRIMFEPMTEADLDDVCEVEKRAYAHPWSRRNFADSVAALAVALIVLELT